MLGEQFCLFINPIASLNVREMPSWQNQNANESFNGMMVFDTTAHCNNDEKDALDIMELLGIDSRYYMAKCCRSVNMRRTRSSIYRMSEPQKKRRKVLR